MQMVSTQVLHLAGNRTVTKGEFFESDDPIVKAAPAAFVTLEAWALKRGGVEQATASPGETRAVKKPRKKKAKPEAVEAVGDADEDS